MHKFFLEGKRKKLEEEETMKTQLEKRKKDHEKDFLKKYIDAISVCEKMGLEKEMRDEYNRVKIN